MTDNMDNRLKRLSRFVAVILIFASPAHGADRIYSLGNATVKVKVPDSVYEIDTQGLSIRRKNCVVYYRGKIIAIEKTKDPRKRKQVPVPEFTNMVVLPAAAGGMSVLIDGSDPFVKYAGKVTTAGEFIVKEETFDASKIKTFVIEGMNNAIRVSGSKKRRGIKDIKVILRGFEADIEDVKFSHEGKLLRAAGKGVFQPFVSASVPGKTALTVKECQGGNITGAIASIYLYAEGSDLYTVSNIANAYFFLSESAHLNILKVGSLNIKATGNSICDVTFGTDGTIDTSGSAKVTIKDVGVKSRSKTAGQVRITANGSSVIYGLWRYPAKVKNLHINAVKEASVTWHIPTVNAWISTSGSATVKAKKPSVVRHLSSTGSSKVEWLE